MIQKNVKQSLMSQLAALGPMKNHYEDLINDYMRLWDVKNDLFKDIKKRGVMYKDYSAAGNIMQKNNPSIKEVVMVNRQMLSILKEIGITTIDSGGEADDKEM